MSGLFLMGAVSLCAAADDGIALRARLGTLGEGVVLEWDGGEPFFEVFRSTDPSAVVDPARKLGETPDRAWTDRPPPGSVFFYVVTGRLDRFPPLISPFLTPAPGASGWNDTNVQVSFECTDVESGISSCAAPLTLIQEGAGQEVNGTAVDMAGNSASVRLHLNIDKTPPHLAITSPGAIVLPDGPAPEIRLEYSDATAGIDSASVRILLDGSTPEGCQIGPIAAICPLPTLEAGLRSLSAEVRDRAGWSSSAHLNVLVSDVVPLEVRILDPEDGLLTRNGTLNVSGTVSEAAVTVTINGVPALVSGGAFTASPVPLVEGSNTITAVATNAEQGLAARGESLSYRDRHDRSLVLHCCAWRWVSERTSKRRCGSQPPSFRSRPAIPSTRG